MPNVLLTTRCNLACPYCFAQEKLSSRRTNMSIENVQYVIDFLKRSDFPIFRVMGGEPTLHPRFNEIVEMAMASGMRVDVLSNATWSENTGAFFARIPTTKLMFLLNIDHPDRYSQKQWSVIERNLTQLKGRGGITLSFNIFEKQPRGSYILDLARRYDFKYIRLSLSLPVLGAGNSHIPIEELHEVTPFILRFNSEAEASGISVKFDNAVPMCIFTEQQLGHLLLHGVYDLDRNVHCDPIIDIGPDLTIWSCFCLSPLKNRRLDEFNTLAEAQDYYRKVWGVYQHKVYPLTQCKDCFYREKWGCQGGCLSYTIMKDNGLRYEIGSPDPSEAQVSPGDTYRLADDVKVFFYDLPSKTCILRKTTDNLEIEIDPSFGSVLPMLDGQHRVEEITSATQLSSQVSGPLQSFIQNVLEENFPNFLHALVLQGFVVKVS